MPSRGVSLQAAHGIGLALLIVHREDEIGFATDPREEREDAYRLDGDRPY
jgi:hypothetical protein